MNVNDEKQEWVEWYRGMVELVDSVMAVGKNLHPIAKNALLAHAIKAIELHMRQTETRIEWVNEALTRISEYATACAAYGSFDVEARERWQAVQDHLANGRGAKS